MFVPLREVKASKGKVISDKDLEILLDRSDLLGEETHHFISTKKPDSIIAWFYNECTVNVLSVTTKHVKFTGVGFSVAQDTEALLTRLFC